MEDIETVIRATCHDPDTLHTLAGEPRSRPLEHRGLPRVRSLYNVPIRPGRVGDYRSHEATARGFVQARRAGKNMEVELISRLAGDALEICIGVHR